MSRRAGACRAGPAFLPHPGMLLPPMGMPVPLPAPLMEGGGWRCHTPGSARTLACQCPITYLGVEVRGASTVAQHNAVLPACACPAVNEASTELSVPELAELKPVLSLLSPPLCLLQARLCRCRSTCCTLRITRGCQPCPTWRTPQGRCSRGGATRAPTHLGSSTSSSGRPGAEELPSRRQAGLQPGQLQRKRRGGSRAAGRPPH